MFDYTAPAGLLKDRIILVTGAGRGIGAEAARNYAALGATVLLLGKTEQNLNNVYDEIVAAGHPEPVVIPLDLETAQPDAYHELAAMVESEFGRLDGLLHNASILGPRTPLEQLTGENFAKVMQINVNAMFMLNSAMLPVYAYPKMLQSFSLRAVSAVKVVRTGVLMQYLNLPPKA